MLELFQYGFMIRGLEVGIAIGLVAPLIGIFLVLRRYSLIADTLSHVSFAGVALGLLLGIHPLFTALGATVISSVLIERLRLSKKVYGESALSLFLSGSLALALVFISVGKGFSVNIFNYLFGSIVTVTQIDLYIIVGLALFVGFIIAAFYKELVYSTFDEESARVGGIPTGFLNTLFIMLSAIVISFAIPVVGILLISALIVIPVISSLQLGKSFFQTILFAQGISVCSVVGGIISSFYLHIPAGAAIVLIAFLIFAAIFLSRKK